MDACLYDPADCESERTVIISELQGGENDPEQLLDTEVNAAAFKVHPYHHPTIGWLSDLQTMTRDDLYGHYRRYYVPSNATLVIVGDVDTDDVLRRVESHFGGYRAGLETRARAPGRARSACRTASRAAQGRHHGLLESGVSRAGILGRRRSFRCSSPTRCLNGAAGLNIWSQGGVSRPQRSARLYRALVDGGLASTVSGALLPTEHPYLYAISASVAEGQTLAAVEEAILSEIERLRRDGITPAELAKVNAQLRARFVYDADSVTDIAHQLGYFETIASWRAYTTLRERLDAVTPELVHAAATRYLIDENRTIGWFEPK